MNTTTQVLLAIAPFVALLVVVTGFEGMEGFAVTVGFGFWIPLGAALLVVHGVVSGLTVFLVQVAVAAVIAIGCWILVSVPDWA